MGGGEGAVGSTRWIEPPWRRFAGGVEEAEMEEGWAAAEGENVRKPEEKDERSSVRSGEGREGMPR